MNDPIFQNWDALCLQVFVFPVGRPFFTYFAEHDWTAVVRHVQFSLAPPLEKFVLQIVLIIGAVLFCLVLQALDDLLSQFGVVSVAHGALLGYAQVFASKELLEWGGYSLGWFVVILISICALGVSVYKIRNTGTRWVFAFNFGILFGIIYGGYDLI
jgi:hypothetical protein